MTLVQFKDENISKYASSYSSYDYYQASLFCVCSEFPKAIYLKTADKYPNVLRKMTKHMYFNYFLDWTKTDFRNL